MSRKRKWGEVESTCLPNELWFCIVEALKEDVDDLIQLMQVNQQLSDIVLTWLHTYPVYLTCDHVRLCEILRPGFKEHTRLRLLLTDTDTEKDIQETMPWAHALKMQTMNVSFHEVLPYMNPHRLRYLHVSRFVWTGNVALAYLISWNLCHLETLRIVNWSNEMDSRLTEFMQLPKLKRLVLRGVNCPIEVPLGCRADLKQLEVPSTSVFLRLFHGRGTFSQLTHLNLMRGPEVPRIEDLIFISKHCPALKHLAVPCRSLSHVNHCWPKEHGLESLEVKLNSTDARMLALPEPLGSQFLRMLPHGLKELVVKNVVFGGRPDLSVISHVRQGCVWVVHADLRSWIANGVTCQAKLCAIDSPYRQKATMVTWKHLAL